MMIYVVAKYARKTKIHAKYNANTLIVEEFILSQIIMDIHIYCRSWSTEQSQTIQRNISSSNRALRVGGICKST